MVQSNESARRKSGDVDLEQVCFKLNQSLLLYQISNIYASYKPKIIIG